MINFIINKKCINSLIFLTVIFCFFFFFCTSICFSKQDYSKFIYKGKKEVSHFEKWLNSLNFKPFDGSYAIIIAISNYDRLPHIVAAREDAKKMKDFLMESNEFDEIVVLKDKDATFEVIRYFMLDYFPKKMKNGKYRFLFYFSGHGTQHSVNNKKIYGSLLLKKATGELSDLNAIDMYEIERWSYVIENAKHVLFLLDCCFSGLAGQEVKSGYDSRVNIKKLAKEDGRHLITAGGADETSIADLKRWRGSLFTEVVINGMKGNADMNNDGVVTTYELFIYAQTAVRNEAEKKGYSQIPLISQLGSYNDKGQYFFVYKKPILRDCEKPRADAGDSLTLVDFNKDGKELANLDASGSSSDVVKYEWFIDESPIGTGLVLLYNFPLGIHVINLKVTNDCEGEDKDSIFVQVKSPLPTFSPVDGSISKEITNTIGQTFVLIKRGEFIMGSRDKEPSRKSDEKQHKVRLTRNFYMQTTEVTQGQWREIMGGNPSHFKDCGENCPVENVSWIEVQTFIKQLNDLEGHKAYRLPTEAEWEYACRAGSTTAYSWGDMDDCSKMMYQNDKGSNYSKCVDFRGNKEKFLIPDSPAPVMSYEPNEWGLYDMHGNVREWCLDWYGGYETGSVTDPTGPREGKYRIVRGGGWNSRSFFCQSTSRDRSSATDKVNNIGFRLIKVLN